MPSKKHPTIPSWLIWVQCIAFVMLYAVWILPEIVGFRNTAMVGGALASLYPIYQYRYVLLKKSALSMWCIVALFIWAILHLLFFSQDYGLQFQEIKRIWKYAAISAIFALGLGLSLSSLNFARENNLVKQRNYYWLLIYFGLATPILIYLIKYGITNYSAKWGLEPPPYLQIYFSSQPYYVPKTDYVAFCLPPLAIALGKIQLLCIGHHKMTLGDYGKLISNVSLILATLFLFYIQDIKNGMVYATVCVGLFVILIFFSGFNVKWWKKFLCFVLGVGSLSIWLYPHTQKNDSWKTLIADTKIAFQTEKYDQWKYAGSQGYPTNEYGKIVSITNYERGAWFKIGCQLAFQNPLGFGLIEDSFKRMAKTKWPEASPNLSHTHSGWLDLILGIGIPGFLLIFISIIFIIKESKNTHITIRLIILWGTFSLSTLWITTEVSATVTFAALIFFLMFFSGLTINSFSEQKI